MANSAIHSQFKDESVRQGRAGKARQLVAANAGQAETRWPAGGDDVEDARLPRLQQSESLADEMHPLAAGGSSCIVIGTDRTITSTAEQVARP